MDTLTLPFSQEMDPNHQHSDACGILRMLPASLQEVCTSHPHLVDYLHLLPLDKIGVPEFHAKPARQLGDLKVRNLIYPVSEDTVIHILTDEDDERDFYIPIEPSMGADIAEKLAQVEEALLEYAESFAYLTDRAEREASLSQAIDAVCARQGSQRSGRPRFARLFRKQESSGGLVPVSPRELKAIRYLILRDKVGMGIMEPMIKDPYIEDISCSGVGAIYLEHKVFEGMKSALTFNTHEELDQFVIRMSEQIRRPVTMRNPIVDATLPDGSRINIVYGRDVSQRGSNFTIRKFNDTPLSIFELVDFGSLDYRMAAYLSIVLEEGMNTFVAGETASGKTTLMNAITVFVPPSAKVVSIEDTPEVQVPHGNWLREVSKAPRKGEQGAEVSMLDLLKAALRQRPNLIIIGEIRGEEGLIAFQAMQTGHAVMATFHAAAVEKLIQRLTGSPINVPKTYMDNLNVVVIQSAVRLPNGKMGRRALSISEIVGYDTVSDSFSFVEVFRWNQVEDKFEFVGDKNSYLLEEKIAARRGIPSNKKWQIYELLERRARVFQRLHQEKGIKGYYELLRVLAKAREQGVL